MKTTSGASVFSLRDFSAAFGVILIWGLNFVAMKLALRDFTPFQLGAIRYVFAVLPLIFFIKRPALPARWLLYYGLAQGVGQFGLLFVALHVGMTAALASVMMQTQVFFTTLLGMILLSERISGPLRIGLALAAVGLGCFAMGAIGGGLNAGAGAVTLLGLALTLAAAFMWSASNIVARKAQQSHPGYDTLAFVVWSSLVPILPFTLMSVLFDAPELHWKWTQASAAGWGGAAYLGWIATLMAYAMWTGLFKRHPANRVAPFSLGVPLVGLAAGVGLLGEVITPWQWGGIGFVVAALLVVMFGAHAATKFPRRFVATRRVDHPRVTNNQ